MKRVRGSVWIRSGKKATGSYVTLRGKRWFRLKSQSGKTLADFGGPIVARELGWRPA